MVLKNIALLGADGTLGPSILSALIASDFTVTVLKRQSSKSPPSQDARELRLPDEFDLPSLINALRGHDALVVAINATQLDLQLRLVDACVAAGVARYIPADFGSCDSSGEREQALLPLYRMKAQVREHAAALAAKHPHFSWTSIVCGHFFDWKPEFLHLWIRERRADVLDSGDHRFSASTLAQIGRATARALRSEDYSKNRLLYVQSFCTSQREIIAAYERATGGKDWQVRHYDAAQFEREKMAKVTSGDKDAIDDVVWLLGTLDANWETRETFAMRALGLEDEDLDAAVRRVVDTADR